MRARARSRIKALGSGSQHGSDARFLVHACLFGRPLPHQHLPPLGASFSVNRACEDGTFNWHHHYDPSKERGVGQTDKLVGAHLTLCHQAHRMVSRGISVTLCSCRHPLFHAKGLWVAEMRRSHWKPCWWGEILTMAPSKVQTLSCCITYSWHCSITGYLMDPFLGDFCPHRYLSYGGHNGPWWHFLFVKAPFLS